MRTKLLTLSGFRYLFDKRLVTVCLGINCLGINYLGISYLGASYLGIGAPFLGSKSNASEAFSRSEKFSSNETASPAQWLTLNSSIGNSDTGNSSFENITIEHKEPELVELQNREPRDPFSSPKSETVSNQVTVTSLTSVKPKQKAQYKQISQVTLQECNQPASSPGNKDGEREQSLKGVILSYGNKLALIQRKDGTIESVTVGQPIGNTESIITDISIEGYHASPDLAGIGCTNLTSVKVKLNK